LFNNSENLLKHGAIWLEVGPIAYPGDLFSKARPKGEAAFGNYGFLSPLV